jgi:pimeloyl-ACP methyl ester carboxylesterase
MGRIGDVGWGLTGRLVSVAPVPSDLPVPSLVHLPGRGRTAVIDTGTPADGVAGPPLILLHALACTGLLTWYPCLDALRKRYRVVIFDQRWHGQGIRSPQFRLEDCADDVAAVADVLGIGRFVVAGYSMGSLVAQLAWRQHPDRVAGAVFGASTTKFYRGASEPKGLDVVANRLSQLAERRMHAAPAGDPATKTVGDNRWALAQLRSTSSAEITGAGAVISRFDSSAWIHQMDVPTSVVLTLRDRAIPPEHQRRLARALPQSTTYEIDAGHASCVMNAAAFRPGLVAACASVSVRLQSVPGQL